MLLAGGDDGLAAGYEDAALFDSVSGTFTVVAPMLGARTRHAAVALPSGKVLVVGGRNGSFDPQRSPRAEIYDPEKNVWKESVPTLGIKDGNYHYLRALPVDDTRTVFLTPSCQMAMFDGVSESWRDLPYSPRGYIPGIVALLNDGRLMVVGRSGCDGTALDGKAHAEIFDIESESWSVVTAPKALDLVDAWSARAHHLPCGLVAVTGLGGSSWRKTSFYDVAGDRWFDLPDYQYPDNYAQSVLLPDGRIMVTHGNLTSTTTGRSFPMFLAE